MDNATYLYAALAVTLIGLLGYLYYLGQRARELRRDFHALEQQHRHEGTAPGGQSS